MLGRLLLIAASTVTIAVTAHAALGWLLLWAVTTAAVTTKVTSKSQGTEARLNRLITNQGNVNVAQNAATGAVNTRVNGLSGQLTGGETNTSSSSTTTNGLPNGQITGTSGGASAGTAHTHGGGSYAVTNGQHSHSYTDGHDHVLPFV